MEDKSNPLLCDPETGFCEIIPQTDSLSENKIITENKEKPIRIVYFTDPICSACWGIEGALRKMKLEYGDQYTIEYHMGGLLPSFGGGYNAGGITGPADVAEHWDQASDYYQMPIDGDVWLENPLSSSYPPSIAFKAAELQDADKAIKFQRIMREMLFLQKQNISKWEVIEQAANAADLDTQKLKTDYDGKAKDLFDADLKLSRSMGVRGFPTLYFFGKDGKQQIVYGSRPYSDFEKAISGLQPDVKKQSYNADTLSLIKEFGSLTVKELSVIVEISMEEAQDKLKKLENEGKVIVITSKKGNLWRVNPE